MPNRLIRESSPYLLQHAHNPVDWFAWGQEALLKAQEEDLPILVSVGYSACHWCHVMERESFENPQIAQVMNQYFVNIKIDREERPDLDQIYMDAIQAMGLRGGWPLNVFLTPQGKPFYGGTYFPPTHWKNLLEQINTAFIQNRDALEDSAEKFTLALNQSEIARFGLKKNLNEAFSPKKADIIFEHLAKHFDTHFGGLGTAPKFPMPCIYEFLLAYYFESKNPKALQHLELSLQKMAQGGIYDQIAGGFARYSTDTWWFAPHFEKMLYDNAQLISLYAKTFMLTKNPFYKKIVVQSLDFVLKEWLSPENAFYAALDADSQGEEGKFYVWEYQQITEILQEQSQEFCEYYGVSESGNWEKGQNILYVASKNTPSEEKIQTWHEKLLKIREQRPKPLLDDKILCSWNALMLKALVDAYNALGNEQYLELAQKNADFILQKCYKNGKLFHSYKNGTARFLAFLEDYALCIESFTLLYEACFEEKYLLVAQEWANYVLENFFDEQEGFFFFTDQNAEKLISRKKEIFDNVIPASNSILAHAFWRLGKILDEEKFYQISQEMLARIEKLLLQESRYLANWASLYLRFSFPNSEIVITGPQSQDWAKKIRSEYLPNKVILGTQNSSSALSLLQNRISENSFIYVCQDKTCQMPVQNPQMALAQLKNLE